MKFRNFQKQNGFTLIEVLLYVSIVGIILIVITSFFSVIIQTNNRFESTSMVDQNGAQILEYITFTIRNSTGITAPTAGVSANTLTLTVSNATNSPTIFDLNSGTIRVKEGTGSNINLSSNNVTASALTFKNLTPGSAKSVIKFEFILSFKNPGNRNELNYSKVFYGTATIR